MAKKKNAGTLIAHRGCVPMSIEEINRLAPPAVLGARHKPIPHGELIEAVHMVLGENGYEVDNEQFAVGKVGIFGVMNLAGEINEDMGPAIGLRASNTMKMAVQFVCGEHVFVCDNMAFNGSFKLVHKKQTKGLDLMDALRFGMENIGEEFTQLGQKSERMKTIGLEDKDAKAFLLDFAVKGRYPAHLLEETYQEYFEPRHEVFRPRNVWGLHNAITEKTKELKSMIARLEVLEDLAVREGTVFGI